ncbi:aldehyde dehydrogenase family protein [Amycolatopsis tucumanensis]|uniref:aldehyde dehydrogenase family protein n=1 Tax=Amycolatopsis tucumanensis TaxID=401106 RepID=UPI003D726D7A
MEAQRGWSATPPGERAAVSERATRIIGERQAEIVDWLAREAGATPPRAAVEVGIVRAVTAAAVRHTEEVVVTTDSDVRTRRTASTAGPPG